MKRQAEAMTLAIKPSLCSLSLGHKLQIAETKMSLPSFAIQPTVSLGVRNEDLLFTHFMETSGEVTIPVLLLAV